ncbi:CoA pyrophosphatase [bacterium]|nr:CoA pyrophosphatase [bacterium]
MSIETFDYLVDKLSVRLRQPLPGAAAHDVMRATPIGQAFPKFEHMSPPKPGSVLILLYPNNGRILFPLIQRPVYTGAHSGQVSFPGGKAETGEDAITTALREGQEEIGIDPSGISIIGRLSDFFVIPSNFMVSPVVAFTHQEPLFIPDSKEVENIIRGSVLDLIQKDAIKKKQIIAAGRFAMMAPHFEIESQIVWGATAMMLNELRTIILELYGG